MGKGWGSLGERLASAVFGGVLGALLGGLCWWLYGLAYSLRFHGPGIDPALRHWLVGMGGSFALLGLVLGARVADWLGDALSAIISLEWDTQPAQHTLVLVLALGLLVALLWFSAPGR